MAKARFMPGRIFYGTAVRATRVRKGKRQHDYNDYRDQDFPEEVTTQVRIIIAICSVIGAVLGIWLAGR